MSNDYKLFPGTYGQIEEIAKRIRNIYYEENELTDLIEKGYNYPEKGYNFQVPNQVARTRYEYITK